MEKNGVLHDINNVLYLMQFRHALRHDGFKDFVAKLYKV